MTLSDCSGGPRRLTLCGIHLTFPSPCLFIRVPVIPLSLGDAARPLRIPEARARCVVALSHTSSIWDGGALLLSSSIYKVNFTFFCGHNLGAPKLLIQSLDSNPKFLSDCRHFCEDCLKSLPVSSYTKLAKRVEEGKC